MKRRRPLTGISKKCADTSICRLSLVLLSISAQRITSFFFQFQLLWVRPCWFTLYQWKTYITFTITFSVGKEWIIYIQAEAWQGGERGGERGGGAGGGDAGTAKSWRLLLLLMLLCVHGDHQETRDGDPGRPPGLPEKLLSCGPDVFSVCFTSTETVKTISDGEPRTSTAMFTQLLNSDRDVVSPCLFITPLQARLPQFRSCVKVKVAVLGFPSWWALRSLWT